jgi:hypothetical protein
VSAFKIAPRAGIWRNSLLISLLAGNWMLETGSRSTASATTQSGYPQLCGDLRPGPAIGGLFCFQLGSLCSCRRIRPYWGGGLRGEKSRSWRDVRPNSDWRFHPGVGLNAGQLSLRDAAFAQRDLTQTASPVSGAAGSPSGVVRLWGEN